MGGSIARSLWLERVRRRRYVIAYVIVGAWFLAKIACFYDPHCGFTALVNFGDRFAWRRIPELRGVAVHSYARSYGYDGQFYAQVAVAGNPFAFPLRIALDNPGYRARRILLPMLAYVVGLARPAWVLEAYALSNVACWLVLAFVLARWWFPPDGLQNLVRWVGVMFGAGMLISVACSLTDGPSLLALALGMRCVELNRPWLGAATLGAAGLVRETMLLALPAFVRARPWRRTVALAAVAVLPVLAWLLVLYAQFHAASKGALGRPLEGLLFELEKIHTRLLTQDVRSTKADVCVLVATCTQIAFILLRPRLDSPWWRMSIGFVVLALFLGRPFWDDAVSGVPRTLLPLALGFNVLVPRTRAGLALLLAGNLTVLGARDVLRFEPDRGATVDPLPRRHPPGPGTHR